jgi:hypothetical protein
VGENESGRLEIPGLVWDPAFLKQNQAKDNDFQII